MKKFLKLCFGYFENESRNYRELAAAKEAGFDDILVFAFARNKAEKGTMDTVKGFPVKRISLKLSPPKFPRIPVLNGLLLNTYRASWLFSTMAKWACLARKEKANVLSCHDIYALLFGYVSTWFMQKSKRPKLVYDSHEFEIGRNAKRGNFLTKMTQHLERFLIKRCTLSVMVNDSIADEVQRVYGLATRPTVVRNIPEKWTLDPAIIAAQRAEMEQLFSTDNDLFIAMYHGIFLPNRGIEVFVEAVAANPKVMGVLLGFAMEDSYLADIKALIQKCGAGGRILFLPAVPSDELWQYVGAADVGVMLIQNTCKSYYYALPNKLFENIQSMTPVIASNFPEMGRLIERYNIGLVCNPADVQQVGDCLEKMRTNKMLYAGFKQNLPAAKNELCWENEKTVLVDAYRALLSKSSESQRD